MTSKFSRVVLAATCAAGVSGLVAGPAQAINNYVTQPVVTGASAVTPESALLTGAIDTGGDPAVTFNASAVSPFAVGGLAITAPANLNGIPVGAGFYSTALFEADPLSDYTAAGDQAGPETVTAGTVEVPTTTGLSAVSSEIGAYPAASGNGASPLTPGTQYVYWVVEQAGESDAATTVNEYDANDLASWIAGKGPITAAGFASTSQVSSSSSLAAWSAGTGKYAGDPVDPTTIPGSIVNPDFACVLNTTIAANTNGDWTAELAAGKDPVAAGGSSLLGTAVPYGVTSISATGVVAAASGQQPAEQGPCVSFFGGNSTNFYTSPTGTFTTPPLGTLWIGKKGTISGANAVLKLKDKSIEPAAGTITLTAKKGGATVATGTFKLAAHESSQLMLKLTKAGTTAAAGGSLVAKVTLSSTTDQPTATKKVTLKG